jgi:tRNA threonylcarbamoyladenosine biosynthesis protein TsaB
MLTIFVDEIMRSARLEYRELDAIAVSAGPGSYTGLRIGASVAKGLCYALGKPLLAVPTLAALANGIRVNSNIPEAVYMPVMDARRMDIYTALYDRKGNELMPAAMHTINHDLEVLLAKYPKVLVGGNASAKFKQAVATTNIEYISDIDCDATAMASLSEARFVNGNFENMAYFEPFYLHEFQPKLKTP